MSEAVLQQTFVAMFRFMYPDLVLNLSLNGISLNGLSTQQKSQLIAECRKQGLENGIQDLSIYLPNGLILNLEFKRPNGGVQSPEQKLIQSKLLALGHNYHLVRDLESIFQLIADHTTTQYRLDYFSKLQTVTNLPFPIDLFKQYYYL